MATLALSVAGAGLGQLAGIGAGTGWMLGSTLGRMLSADEGSSGGSLGELKVTGASYGASIARVYGTMRLAGQVIWLGNVRTVTNKQSGGKGAAGGGAAGSGRSYRIASFAILICEGEMDALLKIWADGALIFNAEGTGERQISGLSFRFYSGSAEQDADPLISADEEAGASPAYRGCSYVVFEDLNLSSFGNRIPNFEFLVSRQAISNYPQQSGEVAPFAASQMIMDADAAEVISYEASGINKVRKISLTDLTILQEADVGSDFPLLPHSYMGFCRDRLGNIWAGSGYALLAGRKIHRFNSFLMGGVQSADLPSGVGAITWSVDLQGPLPETSFQVAGSQQNAQVVIFDQDLSVVDAIDVSSLSCGGALRDQQEGAWLAMTANEVVRPFDDLQIVHVTLFAHADLSGTTTKVTSEIFTLDSADLTAGNPSEVGNNCKLLRYLAGQDELVFQNNYRLFKWSTISHSLTATRDGDFSAYEFIGHAYAGSEVVFLRNGRWVVYLSDYDLSEVASVDLLQFDGVSSVGHAAHDPISDSIVLLSAGASAKRLYLRRYHGESAGYKTLIEVFCAEAGLEAAQIDASAVTGEVDGYVVARPSSLRDVLESILLSARLQMVESGGQLVFRAQEDGGKVALEQSMLRSPPAYQRLQESELPLEIRLKYLASDAGYQPGAQSVRRAHAPYATQDGQGIEAITLPMAMAAENAKQICFNTLSDAWQERLLLDVQLPRQFLALEPGDQISITDENDVPIYEGRISESHLGVGLELEAQMVGLIAQASAYEAVADAGSGYVEMPIRRASSASLMFLNTPLLRDEDATAGTGSRQYLAVQAKSPANWNGAEIYRSAAGDRFDVMAQAKEHVIWGVAGSSLPATERPWMTDRENYLLVRFASDDADIESVSELEMLNGANALLVGDEIIQFATVQIQPDGSYKLSTLLRARRGTDYALATHKVGERVLVLETDSVLSTVQPLSMIHQGQYYKVAGIGRNLNDAAALRHVHLGRDLMPYSPVHVSASKTALELSLSWVRRSRIGSAGLAATLPLAEQSERYEVSLSYDGQSVSHYVTGAPEFIYGLDQFNTDFSTSLLALPELAIEIFQLSDAIGRGFSTKEIV